MILPFVHKPRAAAAKMSTSRTILIGAVCLCFAAMVPLAPAAYAQRGGGGHAGGGGGHVGGVGGGFHAAGAGFSGGARGSVGSSGRASGGGFGSASGAAVYAHGSTTNRGYSRTYFVPAGGARDGASSFVGESSGMAGGATGTRAFAANNRLWEAPPQQGRGAVMPRQYFMPPARPVNSGMANPLMNGRFTNAQNLVVIRRGAPSMQPFDGVSPALSQSPVMQVHRSFGTPYAGMTATSPNQFAFNSGLGPFFNSRFHPIGPGPCFAGGCGLGVGSPFFSGFGFGTCFEGGFGCGFGPFGFGDLEWGGGLFGYGYGNGWFYPPAQEVSEPPENSTEDNQPPVYAPDYYFVPPPGEAEAAPAQPQQPVVKLVLTDGTIFGVYSYWIQDDRLFYVTTYNIKTSIAISDLDLQKTVDLNSKLGVTFSLSSKPPQQQQPPDTQPDNPQQ